MRPEPHTVRTPPSGVAPIDTAAEAEYQTGLTLQAENRTTEAAERFRAALRLAPKDERAHFSLAKTLHDLGRRREALLEYRRTLALRPDCAEAYFNMGLLLWETDRPQAAAEAFQQAVCLAPGLAPAHNNLGIALRSLGRHDEASVCFEQAIRENPDYSEAWCNAGRLRFEQQRWDDAIACFEKALALKPNSAPTLHNLGLCHHKKNNLDRAEMYYRKALALVPDHHRVHIDLGNICLDRNDRAGMIEWYGRALALTPGDAEAFLNVARMLRDASRLDEALVLYEQALALDPENIEAHFSRGLIRLTQGRYPEGWPDYEWRRRRAEWIKAYPHRLSSPCWAGEPFVGRTLLVHHEQGLGDTLQFVRYLPLAKARGGKVLLEAPRALRSLLRQAAGADEILELSPNAPSRVPHDLHIPLLSLPGLCGTTSANVPAQIPYLFADPAQSVAWAERLDPLRLNVGIVWSGSAWTARLAEKSCHLRYFLGLTTIPGIRWYALQKEAPAAELAAAIAAGISVWGPQFSDFSDTAAAVAVLDLVISVDTAAAHLAGAMGKPVWVLLGPRPDWRWMLGRTDSPWYPSMRIYRQSPLGSWQEVFVQVANDLAPLARPAEGAP
jgi:tetratricopeptide (TPR) repeat protein